MCSFSGLDVSNVYISSTGCCTNIKVNSETIKDD